MVFLADQAFADVLVETNVQTLVLFCVLLDGELSPYPPVSKGSLVAVFHPPEELRSLDLDIGILFCVSVDFHIDREQVLDGVLLQLLLVTVLLVTDSNQTEL